MKEMLKSALVVLTLAVLAKCEPPPVASGYAGAQQGHGGYAGGRPSSGYGSPAPGAYGAPQAGYGVPNQGFTGGQGSYAGAGGQPHSGYGSPAQGAYGHGAPAQAGHGAYGGGAYGGFRAGLLQGISGGGILNSLFGWAGNGQQKPNVQVNHGGYGGYANPIQPKQPSKFSMGGIRLQYGVKNVMPSVHDDNPWVPITSAPVDVVLQRPAGEYGEASSRSSLSIVPSMSYGYSYKLVPTFAYGPSISGGHGYGR